MNNELLDQELSTDEMKNISGRLVDFSGFKPEPNKGWWIIDGADFRGGFKGSYRQIFHPEFKKLNEWTNVSASSFQSFRGANSLLAQEVQA